MADLAGCMSQCGNSEYGWRFSCAFDGRYPGERSSAPSTYYADLGYHTLTYELERAVVPRGVYCFSPTRMSDQTQRSPPQGNFSEDSPQFLREMIDLKAHSLR